jgi:copper chaperone CopZ
MNTSAQPTEKLRFTTTGITCGGCVNSVRTILGKLPGVGHVDVDVASGTADVEIVRGSLSVEQMNKALEPAGYGLKPAQA